MGGKRSGYPARSWRLNRRSAARDRRNDRDCVAIHVQQGRCQYGPAYTQPGGAEASVRLFSVKVRELRAMAAGMKDLGARALCLRMAMSYEDLAHNKERQVTGSPPGEKPGVG